MSIADAAGGAIGTATIQVGPDLTGFDSRLSNDLDRQSGSISGAFSRLGGLAATAFAGAVAAGVALGVKSAMDYAEFDRGMREVFTLMPGMSEDAMNAMNDQVKDFAGRMGVSVGEVVPALYQAISAGIDPSQVFGFLETAFRNSLGGATDLETSVDGISSAVNAYGEDTLNAASASDVMVTAVREGKVTMDELANSLFNVLPTASEMGVSFEEVNAALATMTSQGVPANVATTKLNMLFSELNNSSSEVGKTFQELTGKTFSEFMQEGGSLGDALSILRDHADKTGGDFYDMFGSIEGGSAALMLTGDNADIFADKVGAMNDAAGSTDEAFATMDQGLGRTIDKVKVFGENVALNIGEGVAVAVDAGQKALPKLFEGDYSGAAAAIGEALGFGPDDPIVKAIEDTLAGIGGFVSDAKKGFEEMWSVVGPILGDMLERLLPLVGKVGEFAGFLAGLSFTVLKDTMITMQPAFEKIAGFGGDIADKLGKLADIIVPDLKSGLEGLVSNVKPGLEDIAKIVGNVVDTLQGMVDRVWPEIQAFFKGMSEKAKEILPKIGGLFSEAFGAIEAILRPALKVVEKLWDKFGDNTIQILAGAFGALAGTLGGVVDIAKGLLKIVHGIFEMDWEKIKEGWSEGFGGLWGVIVANVAGMATIKDAIFQGIGEAITGVLGTIFSTLWNFFTGLPGQLSILGTNLWNWITESLVPALPGLLVGLGEFFGKVFEFIGKVPSTALERLGAMWDWIEFLLGEAWKLLSKALGEKFDGLLQWFKDRPEWFKEQLGNMWEWISYIFGVAWEAFRSFVGEKWDELLVFFIGLPGWFREQVGNFFVWIGEKFEDAWFGFWNLVGDKFDALLGFFLGLPGWFQQQLGNLFGWLGNLLRDGLNAVIKVWNSIEVGGFTIGPWDLPDPLPDIGAFDLPSFGLPKIPEIPELAEGGPLAKGQMALVGEKGPELFIPGHDGAVLPNDWLMRQAGDRGVSIGEINVREAVNPRDVAREVAGMVRWRMA